MTDINTVRCKLPRTQRASARKIATAGAKADPRHGRRLSLQHRAGFPGLWLAGRFAMS